MARVSLTRARRWAIEAFEVNDCGSLINEVTISYNERFSRRMGDANWNKRRIRLSGPLFDIASEEQQEQTVKHEACHIVVAATYGHKVKRSHGLEWQHAMLLCGLRPERCHSIDIERNNRNRQTRLVVPCACPHPPIVRAQATVTRWIRDEETGKYRRRCPWCREVLRLREARPVRNGGK